MTEAKHTPGPLAVRKEPFAVARGENPPCVQVVAPDGHPLFDVRTSGPHGHEAEATAARIVTAYNAHEGLLILLDRMEWAMRERPELSPVERELLEDICAAKAEGGAA
jgi:hypothetical protein